MLRRAASLVVFALLASCNAIAGIEEPIVSSSPTNSAPSERATRFLGDWVSNKARSTETFKCGTAIVPTKAPYTFAITSRGGDLIQAKNVDEGEGCIVVLEVTDDITAQFQEGSHCAFLDGGDVTYTSGLLRLVQDDVITEANVELGGKDLSTGCEYIGRLLLQKKTGGGG